jgi:hypothetical protein
MTLPKFNTMTYDVMWQDPLGGWHTVERDLSPEDAVGLALSLTDDKATTRICRLVVTDGDTNVLDWRPETGLAE